MGFVAFMCTFHAAEAATDRLRSKHHLAVMIIDLTMHAGRKDCFQRSVLI